MLLDDCYLPCTTANIIRRGQLWLYPIKGLRGISLKEAKLTPQGLEYDRHFMLCRIREGKMEKVQLDRYPQGICFHQEIVGGDRIRVKYKQPNEPLVEDNPALKESLEVPLRPDMSSLEKIELNLHQSMVNAYKMGDQYDEWFSACFGFPTVLLYIGDGKRPVLGTFSPKAQQAQTGWLSSFKSYVTGGGDSEPDWLTFSDCAPFLIATEASLKNVNDRLESPIPIVKFRPNIVLDGEEAFDEDFWGEIAINGRPAVTLTKLCNRCTSINVDYATGKVAQGDEGTVLKKLMADRRVDTGNKWSPVFGRYGFLHQLREKGGEAVTIKTGDEVNVTDRIQERPAWDWPVRDPSAARFY